jgi:cell division protein ZipA
MNQLRWILLGAGVALLALIYWQGRRKRFVSAAEQFAPREIEPPQLSESAIVRERRREPAVSASPPTMTFPVDDLPEVQITPPVGVSRSSATLSMEEALSTAALDRLTVTQPLGGEAQPAAARMPPVVEEPQHTLPRPSVAATAPRLARKIVALRVPALALRFGGERLRQVFADLDLRHGRYGIFHRHGPDGASLFSVASMVEPGTFDPPTMENFEYPGVSLFLQLPTTSDGVAAFDAMLSCAQSLQEAFHGGLQGERGKPLTDETIARMREDIADFQHLMRPALGSG